MSPLSNVSPAVINSTANLIAQLRELDELREQVRKALAVSQESATTKAAEPFKRGQRQMSDDVSPRSRFLVRKGCKGWMVYDRQRKGPAMVGTDLAVNLTKEQANQQRRIATITNLTANLVAQLRELDQAREQVRKALLSAKRAPRLRRLNGNSARISRN